MRSSPAIIKTIWLLHISKCDCYNHLLGIFEKDRPKLPTGPKSLALGLEAGDHCHLTRESSSEVLKMSVLLDLSDIETSGPILTLFLLVQIPERALESLELTLAHFSGSV